MVRAGFPKSFGAGVITTSGALGILIPLSLVVMVMASVTTNTSGGALFKAGVIPGIMLAALLSATTWYHTPGASEYPRLAGWPDGQKTFGGPVPDRGGDGGIYTGIFTATEAAAMSAYAFSSSRVFVPTGPDHHDGG